MSTPLTVAFPNEDSLGVKSCDPFLIQSYDLYQSLLGTSFVGVYKGAWPVMVEESDNTVTKSYAVIAFRFDPHNISSTLSSIILQDPSQKIWKSITGPSEAHPHADYWLWAKFPIAGAVPSQRQMYTIIGMTCLAGTVRQQNNVYRSGIELTIEAGELVTDKKI